ncbi:MAG: ATP-binding protein, partial [Cyanobacteria bacterium P01_H01_bin.105]
SVRASEKGLAIADQARQRLGWTKTSTARWWQDAHTSRATLRRFWRGERIQQDAFIAICQTVGLSNWREIAAKTPESSNEIVSPPCPIDWGDAPDIEQFYDREQELQQLQTWTRTAKLITISGLGGTGKTTLALALAEQLQPDFASIIWRSAKTPLRELLTDLIDAPIETVDQGVRQLLKTMQSPRLIILDKINEEQSHLDFLYRISCSRHRSCLLVIGRQPLPPQFYTLNRTQHLSLSGLSANASADLLQACGCDGYPHQLKTLARIYGYSPLALKLIASTIQTVFNGQIAPFLEQETVILPEPIYLLFKQQFETFNQLEKTLIFWLAIWQEPISLCRLQTHLFNDNPAQVIDALATLVRRSLVTQHFLSDEPSFSLQPMVSTFVLDELVKAIVQEIAQAQQQQSIQPFQLLRTHCLIRPGTDDILGDRILTAVQKNYQENMSRPMPLLTEDWLQQAQEDSSSAVGYLLLNLTILRDMLDVP